MHTLLHLVPPALQQATANSHLHRRLLDTLGQVWVSLLWGHCSFLLALVSTRVSLCPPLVCFPVLCKFWQLYGGVNGNLLQEGLCHTQVCCTQSPCPCSRPLLTRTFTRGTQTQFWLSFSVVSGSWCAQGLFEPSEHLWWVWGLVLDAISPLLPSCWGFSFACGHGVSLLVGSNILQWTVVQRRVVVLEFSQEKMSARPSYLPSYATKSGVFKPPSLW